MAIGIGAAGIELDRDGRRCGDPRPRRSPARSGGPTSTSSRSSRGGSSSRPRGHERARLARDSYSYLHLPMFAGIVLVALGVKKMLAHVDEPLETVPAFALFGGVALYLLSHDAIRFRNVRSVNRPPLSGRGGLRGADPGGDAGRRRGRRRARRRRLRRADRLRDAPLPARPVRVCARPSEAPLPALRPRRQRRPGRP